MADHLEVVVGNLPWLPSPNAQLVKTYHRHGVPLVGLVDQNGECYLFVRRYRGEESLSVWLYVRVTDNDVSELDAEAPSLDDTACGLNAFSVVLDALEDRDHNLYALVHEEIGVLAVRRNDTAEKLGDIIGEMIRDADLPLDVEKASEERRLLSAVA